MIRPATVFVVGAGASVPFGFPGGLSLLLDVQKASSAQIDTRIDSRLDNVNLSTFCRRLRNCQELSLDAFLEYQSADYQAAGKRLIAERLLRREDVCHGIAADGGDWIRHAFDLMCRGADGIESFLSLNNVHFITYNYDRLIEVKLARGLRAKWGEYDGLGEALDDRVVHLHGSLGDIDATSADYVPFGARDNRDENIGSAIKRQLATCERTIKIVHEVSDNNSAFKTAREWLAQAECVLFLGFGFGVTNVDRLGLDHVNRQASICYTRFGMTEQEWAYYVREPLNKARLSNTRSSNAGWDCLTLVRENLGELVARYPS